MNPEKELGYKLIAIGTAIVAGGVGGQVALALVSGLFFQTEPMGPMAVIVAGGTGAVLGLSLWLFLARQFRRPAKDSKGSRN